MAKDVKIDAANEAEKNEEVQVTLTQEQLEKLNSLEEKEKELEAKAKEVEARIKEVSDAELNKLAKDTKKTLANTQKMVSVTIPVSELNPDDKVVPVTINGYTWQIKRGEEVEVPYEVKRILKEAKYI